MAATNYSFYFSQVFGYDDQSDGQKYGDDFNSLIPILTRTPKAQPTELTIWASKRIDGIQMLYPGTLLNQYGGDGGTKNTLLLNPGNPIDNIQFWGSYLRKLGMRG